MIKTDNQTIELTAEEFENLLAHFRSLTSSVGEMLWTQSQYFKTRNKQMLIQAKKLEAATKKIAGYCESLEKLFNMDTKERERDIFMLSHARGL